MNKDPVLVEEGLRLKAAREILRLTHQEFAAALKCKSVTVRNAESGNARLGARKFATAMRMAAQRSVASGGGEDAAVSEPYEHYGGTGNPKKTVARDVDISEVLRLSRSEAVQSAALALAVATGLSEEEALAEVIRVGLSRRS